MIRQDVRMKIVLDGVERARRREGNEDARVARGEEDVELPTRDDVRRVEVLTVTGHGRLTLVRRRVDARHLGRGAEVTRRIGALRSVDPPRARVANGREVDRAL